MRRGGGRRGGSRSSYRSSRRHHYRHSRGRGYYGGGYYGRRRGPGIIGMFIIIGFFLIFGIFAIPAIFGLPNTTDVNLGSYETRLFHPNLTTRDGIEIDDPTGIIQTHFFDSKPPISDNPVIRSENETNFIINSDFYEYWAFYLIKGSTVAITWSSTQSADFYVVEGKSDFDKWKEGESTEKDSQIGVSGSYTYTATSDKDAYFIFYNYNTASLTINITFKIQAKVYDISNSLKSITGSFTEQLDKEQYIVVYNPSSQDIDFKYTETPKYSFGLILVTILVIGGIITFLIVRAVKSKNKNQKQRRSTSPTRYASSSPPSRQYAPSKSPTQTKKPQYHQRPSAKFCNACGSGLLPNSTFCSDCGTKV